MSRQRWTPEEEDYLKKHYAREPVCFLVSYLSRSRDAIRQKASSLGLSKAYYGGGDEITVRIMDFLRTNREPKTAAQIESYLIRNGILAPEVVGTRPSRLRQRLYASAKRESSPIIKVGKQGLSNLYSVSR